MRKLLPCLFILAVAVSLAWAGGDKDQEPWKTKAYEKWNQKEVTLVLNNSPWAIQAHVPAEWLAGKNKSAPGGRTIAQENQTTDPELSTPNTAKNDVSMPSGAGNGRGAAMTPQYGGLSTAEVVPTTYFEVRWSSARVMREAIVRNAIIAGQAKQSDADQYLAQPVADYELAVGGPDMTPFTSLTEQDLKAAAYLEVKPSKRKVQPVSVAIQTLPDGKINSVIFSFDRQVENGEPLIRPEDTGVDFHCKLKHLDLETLFDTHKMVADKGADF